MTRKITNRKQSKNQYIEKNIKYFKERVNFYFHDFFKLSFLDLTIMSQNKGDAKASSYWHNINKGAMMVTICYSKHFVEDKETTKEEIDKVAFHEVWECILSELQELVDTRTILERDLPNAVHRVIHIMENTVFPLIKDK